MRMLAQHMQRAALCPHSPACISDRAICSGTSTGAMPWCEEMQPSSTPATFSCTFSRYRLLLLLLASLAVNTAVQPFSWGMKLFAAQALRMFFMLLCTCRTVLRNPQTRRLGCMKRVA